MVSSLISDNFQVLIDHISHSGLPQQFSRGSTKALDKREMEFLRGAGF